MTDFVNQPYKVIGRSKEYTNERNTFNGTDYLDHLWGAKFTSGNIVIGSGMPIVWQDEDTLAISVLQLATVTALTSKTFTVTADEELRFNEGDSVWMATYRFDDIENCGLITGINTTTHAITVTVTPTITTGFLYVNTDKANVLVASASAIGAGTLSITLATGLIKYFSVGDIVFEAVTAGTSIKNLGKITDITSNTMTVTGIPTVTTGGLVGICPGIPEILGINTHYVSNITDYRFGTTYTADTQAEYTVQCEVFDHSLDWYSGSKLVIDRMKETIPNIIVSTNQNNGI